LCHLLFVGLGTIVRRPF
jgi:hypothetical protein